MYYVCSVTFALGRHAAVYTMSALLEAVRGSMKSREGHAPICEELKMVNNWHDYFKIDASGEELSREVANISNNYQFKIKKNAVGDTVVYSKQFSKSRDWEALDTNRQKIDGCKLLLKVAATHSHLDCICNLLSMIVREIPIRIRDVIYIRVPLVSRQRETHGPKVVGMHHPPKNTHPIKQPPFYHPGGQLLTT